MLGKLLVFSQQSNLATNRELWRHVSDKERIYKKLEWNLLLDHLANYCQTHEGRKLALDLRPNLSKEATLARWQLVKPLAELFGQGYRAPIGELNSLHPLLKAALKGQILEGTQLREILHVLEAVRRIFAFAQDFASRCSTLELVKKQLLLQPSLFKAIDKAIDPEGALLDTASPELSSLRQQKRALRQSIEAKLKQILHAPAWEPYLQDEFFAIRGDRYVIPIKLDGRGRVAGTIVDTSESGQTLYIEPVALASFNQTLQELELSEKLEMLRILKQLSAAVAQEAEPLQKNYQALIQLDQLSSEAQLASLLKAGPIELSASPTIKLITARHPLLVLSSQHSGATGPCSTQVIANDIAFEAAHQSLIISGPNAGGKTVVLKTLGLLLLMAKAGLLLPADSSSELYLFSDLYLEMGDAQNLSANLSTFSGHILGLKPIVGKAKASDLVLLDELAMGTEPQTGEAIAQAVLEHLAATGCKTLVTTHYGNLKCLALQDPRFRNASMEYSLENLQPTYKLLLDIPGQSYGLELAAQIGLPASLISRAKVIRGNAGSDLDRAISQLTAARAATEKLQTELVTARLEAASEKARWDQEVRLLNQTKQQVAEKLQAKFAKQLAEMQQHFEAMSADLRQSQKEAKLAGGLVTALPELQEKKQQVKKSLGSYQDTLRALSREGLAAKTLPGRPVSFGELSAGQKVFIVPLNRQGLVVKVGSQAQEKVEVQAELLKIKVALEQLRFLTEPTKPLKKSGDKTPLKGGSAAETRKALHTPSDDTGPARGLVMQTSTNTLDLRGMEVTGALEKMWRFLDSAILRAEKVVILVHGHGTDALKQALRKALRHESPYTLAFEPGERHLGGDGVTVVYFDD